MRAAIRATLFVLAAAAAVPAAAAGPVPGAPQESAAERHAGLVRALDAPSERAREEALLELLALPPQERGAVLASPRPTTRAGLRAYARFAARAADVACVPLLVELARADDAAVRREAASGLGRFELGPALLDERVDALARLARDDRDAGARRAAVAALGGVEDEGAAAALAELVRAGGDDASVAAEALARLTRGEAHVARLLEDLVAGAERAPEGPAVVSALLGGYGRALARGASRAEVGARVLASMAHAASEDVARAAAEALDQALVEWDRLGRSDAASAFFEHLAVAGWSPDALDQAGGQRALAEDGDPLAALAAGQRLARRHQATVGAEGARSVATGRVLEAAALLVLERRAEARAALAAAEAALVGALAERPELLLRPFRREAGRAEAAVELWQRLAAVRVFQVFERVADGAEPLDPAVLEIARAAHVAALEAQRSALLGDSDVYASNLEAVLARSYAPRALLAPNARGDDALAWLELHGRTYAALAAVAPSELPGFIGALSAEAGARLADVERRLVDPLADPQRLALLQDLRVADLERVSKRAADPRQIENRALWERVQSDLLERIGRDAEEGFAPLLQYRTIATTALSHAADLRAVGASDRALEHALAARREAEASPIAPTGSEGAWFGARLALAVGTAATDVGDGATAERELLDAHERLLALENDLAQALLDFEVGRRGALVLEAIDPRERRRLERELEDTRGLRAQVLVSLAVNANVRLSDVEAARGWFERALELRRDDFMRVLAACYAARAGRHDEARHVLATVVPAPELDYNLACTHALLGDVERALVHLERALDDLESRGARLRQVQWARADPDFAALRADPRFEALLASRSN